jgi:hypothetical protein
MTYTLFMPADQGIQIAADGVAEVAMTGARALLTRLIRGVREDGRPAAFTDRGERRAYVVSPGFYEHGRSIGAEEIQLWRDVRARLYRLVDDPALSSRLEELDPDLHMLLTTAGLGLP